MRDTDLSWVLETWSQVPVPLVVQPALTPPPHAFILAVHLPLAKGPYGNFPWEGVCVYAGEKRAMAGKPLLSAHLAPHLCLLGRPHSRGALRDAE